MKPGLRSTFQHKYAWLALICVVALSMRLYGLQKSLWLDETFTLAEAFAADFWQATRGSDHPFLYPLMMHG